MHPRFVRFVVLTLTTAALSLAAPDAHADPVCAGATITGTATGTRQVGPYCQPYPFAVLCTTQGAGFRPHAEVAVSACVPW